MPAGSQYAVLAALVAGYFLLRADSAGRAALLTSGVASAAFFAWFHLDLWPDIARLPGKMRLSYSVQQFPAFARNRVMAPAMGLFKGRG